MKQLFFYLLLLPLQLLAFPPKDTTAVKNQMVYGDGRPDYFKQEIKRFGLADAALNKTMRFDATVVPEFSNDYINRYFKPNEDEKEAREEAQKTFDQIERDNHYIDQISPNELTNLPVGIKMGDAKSVTLGIQKAKFFATYTELVVFCKIVLPNGKALFLGADSVKLSREGGFIGRPTLILLGDFQVPLDGGQWLLNFKGGINKQTGEAKKITYATFDCSGLKEINITGEVSFPRSKIVPVDDKNKIIADQKKKVTASFQTTVFAQEFPNFIVEASIPPFATPYAKELAIFKVEKAVLDLSDLRNAPSVQFPKEYKKLVSGNEGLWKGFYAKQVKVVWPKEFKPKQKDQQARIDVDTLTSLEATNVLFDGDFSGRIELRNEMPLDVPGGWDMVLTSLYFNFEAGKPFPEAGFGGYLKLPVSGDNDTLSYTASFGDFENWHINVATNTTMNFPLFMGKAELEPNCAVELYRKQGKWALKAVLNGKMGIEVSKQNVNDPEGKPITRIKGLQFQNLTIATEAPYIQADYFGYTDPVLQLDGFPVSFNNIHLFAKDEEVGLGFGMDVNLMSGKITAGGQFAIVGSLKEVNERLKWKFERVDVSSLKVAADFGLLTINGSVTRNRNHPIMGTGYEGSLGGSLTLASKKIGLQLKAGYGSKEQEGKSFNYWYGEGLVSGVKIPIPSTPIVLTSLGLGVNYHVTRAVDIMEDTSASPLGVGYKPDPSVGIGIKLMTAFDVMDEMAAKGEATLDVKFLSTGGLPTLGFFGKMYFMPNPAFTKFSQDVAAAANRIREKTKFIETAIAQKKEVYNALTKIGAFGKIAEEFSPKIEDEQDAAPLTALLAMSLDMENGVFHANLDVYANLPGGFIQGAGSKGRAGWGVMHADFKAAKWYMHFGNPTDRIGLKADFGFGSAELKSYLMAGNSNLYPMPPPHPVVRDQLKGLIKANPLRETEAASAFAFGFDLGAQFKKDDGVLYLDFEGLVGVDLMLKNYGSLARCKDGNGPIGINGFYMNGQSYLYLQGKAGIDINVLKVKKRCILLQGSLAALAQTGLPNPFWVDAAAKLTATVMGQSVSAQAQFSLGKKCEPINPNQAGGINFTVVSGITPADQDKDVDVFTSPQVIFNREIGKAFEIEDETGVKNYRFGLESFSVLHNGQPVAGKWKFNKQKLAASFHSEEILPPNSSLQATADVVFEEYKNGGWSPVYFNGQKVTEQKTVSFTTGTAPTVIPLNNVTYSYPVVDQQYFYTQEHLVANSGGYLQLEKGQAYLFGDTSQLLEAQFISNGVNQKNVRLSFQYDSIAKKVKFDLPVLNNREAYTLRLVQIPKNAGAESKITEQTRVVETGDVTIEVTENKAEGVVLNNVEHQFVTYDFKSSVFKTFREKMERKEVKKSRYEIINSSVGALHADVYGEEAFDLAEVAGTDYTDLQPLVQPVAILTDAYFVEDINRLLYADYKTVLEPSGLTVNRDTTLVGLLPVGGVELSAWYASMLDAQGNYDFLRDRFPYRYNLATYYNQDFIALQFKVVNRYVNNPASISPVLYRFVEKSFPNIRKGYYNTVFRYRLPGGEWGSSKSFEYFNPF